MTQNDEEPEIFSKIFNFDFVLFIYKPDNFYLSKMIGSVMYPEIIWEYCFQQGISRQEPEST